LGAGFSAIPKNAPKLPPLSLDLAKKFRHLPFIFKQKKHGGKDPNS
jgi:hypothetical protein